MQFILYRLKDGAKLHDLNHSDSQEESHKRHMTEKQFYKEMTKIKDRGSSAVPPKKSASAYIIFGKEKRL